MNHNEVNHGGLRDPFVCLPACVGLKEKENPFRLSIQKSRPGCSTNNQYSMLIQPT